MAGFIYCRLSRDEDDERESLKNQREIIEKYINRIGDTIEFVAEDDNYSGMNFDRPGIKKLYEVAQKGIIDTVYVKDLSRLGRHRLYMQMCVEDLRNMNVRVYSVTENIDSFNENDDLMIGVKGLINDSYVKDLQRKIKTSIRQRQEHKGIIQIPPMGYIKDKNTDKVNIVDEPAEIIRTIYKMFLDSYGTASIAQYLNHQGLKTPAYYQMKLLGIQQGNNRPKAAFEHLWTYSMVKRVLTNPFYCGNVVNHKIERSRITKKQVKIPINEQFVHENMVPAIIPKENWERVQEIFKTRSESDVKSGNNKPCHRYAGILKCGDCESSFTAKRRKNKNGTERIEYVCNGYHRHTKMVCSSHRINESEIDKIIKKELLDMKNRLTVCSKNIESEIKLWLAQKQGVEKNITMLNNNIVNAEYEIEEILMERIKDKENMSIYDKMIERRKEDIQKYRLEIEQIENIDKTVKERKKAMQNSVDLLGQILKEKKLSHANLCLLIEKILIYENENGLKIDICFKAPVTDNSYQGFFKEMMDTEKSCKDRFKRLIV